jgi:16S rRNA processing protein RimM
LSDQKHISIGVVAKPHGLKGHVAVKVDPNYALYIQDLKSVLIEHDGAYVPYLVESYANLNKGIVKLLLAGVTDQEMANRLRAKELFQLAELLSIDKQIDLVGFNVRDSSNGSIGEVLSVIESTAQTMLEVSYEGTEIYIPFVDEFIMEVDARERVIEMDLPEGMLDL